MEKGQILDITIEDMSLEGQGIGKADGFAVFVKNAVLGDKVRIELTKVKKNYGFGKILEIIEPSPWRIEGFCKYQNSCGGCPLGTLDYEGQLALKEKQVKDKLMRLGGIKEPIVMPIIGMEIEPYRYRNKASMVVSTGGLITKKGGIVEPVHEPRVGFYQPKSHEVIDCSDCLLQSPAAMACANALRKFMEEDHITSYDPRWEKGLMRHMIVRTAAGTGEVMVILVINGKGIPNASKLVSMLDDAIYEIPVHEEGPYAGVEFNLESVVVNINKKNTSEILGEECITIAGKPTINEEVAGMSFEISPLSFYQVNREQMVRLYEKALEYADLKDGDRVLDLYCGVGTIGLFAAKSNETISVLGIESVKGAILDANRNATINGIVNARFMCGKAEEVLPDLVSKEEKGELEDIGLSVKDANVVILDPPRAGCDTRLLEAVVKVEPQKIVYVSCDPATLARDIKWLGENGYDFKEATPCDMFPWSGHVETVCLLSRMSNRKPNSHIKLSLDMDEYYNIVEAEKEELNGK